MKLHLSRLRSTSSAFLLLSALFVTGCPSAGTGNGFGPVDDPRPSVEDEPPAPGMTRFRVTVVNATNNQKMSPPAVVLHGPDWRAWSPGEAAGEGLEKLAEGGATDDFLAEAEEAGCAGSVAAEGPVDPGASQVLEVEGESMEMLRLTVATMLIQTNDGFAGLDGAEVDDLEVGEERSWNVKAWDAGTEENTESASMLPPQGGFDAERPSGGVVTVHPGVLTRAEGLEGSALDESHRFARTVAVVRVERLE
jgi:hypothetical protein